jgi:hypothetical protein
MELRITHETRYDYSPAVETAQHMAHLQPLDTPCQRLLAHRLDIAPTPAQRSRHPTCTATCARSFRCSPRTPCCASWRSAKSRRARRSLRPAPLAWEAVRERFRFRAGAAWDAAAEFVFASHHVPRHDAFRRMRAPASPRVRADRGRARPDGAHP